MNQCKVSVSGPYVSLVLCAIFLHDCTSAVTFQYHKMFRYRILSLNMEIVKK